eukprot:gene7469-9176_t
MIKQLILSSSRNCFTTRSSTSFLNNNRLITPSSSLYTYRLYSTEQESQPEQQEQQVEQPIKPKTEKLYTLKTISPLQYKVTPCTKLNSKEPTGQTIDPSLPFRVLRSNSGLLPVYTQIIRSQSKKITVLRKIEGDIDALLNELYNIFGDTVKITRKESTITFEGDHTKTIRVWLRGLGF